MELDLNTALKKMEKYCAYQERAKIEVINKLKKMKVKQSLSFEIINLLVKNNFLNQERFAQTFVRGKFKLKKWGKLKIKFELIKKQVDGNIIEKALTEIDKEEYIQTLEKLFDRKAREQRDINKIIKFLQYKGYETELIIKTKNKLSQNNDTIH